MRSPSAEKAWNAFPSVFVSISPIPFCERENLCLRAESGGTRAAVSTNRVLCSPPSVPCAVANS